MTFRFCISFSDWIDQFVSGNRVFVKIIFLITVEPLKYIVEAAVLFECRHRLPWFFILKSYSKAYHVKWESDARFVQSTNVYACDITYVLRLYVCLMCVRFSQLGYTCACTCQVCGCCIDACIFIKCLESSLIFYFRTEHCSSVARVQMSRKKKTRRRVCFWHISPCRTNSMVLRPATYRTIHLGTTFGKLMYFFFTILLFFIRLINSIVNNFHDKYFFRYFILQYHLKVPLWIFWISMPRKLSIILFADERVILITL